MKLMVNMKSDFCIFWKGIWLKLLQLIRQEKSVLPLLPLLQRGVSCFEFVTQLSILQFEHQNQLIQSLHKNINFFFGVVHSKRNTNATLNIVVLHYRIGA